MKRWESTNVTYLFRYVPTGEYVVRRRRGNSDERVYLGTTVFSVAKWKIPEILKTWRRRAKCAQTVQELAEEWVVGKELDPTMKASTKRGWRDMMASLMRSWPELATLTPGLVGAQAVAGWAAAYSARFSPSNYNHTAALLRGAFDLAISRGALSANPAAGLKRMRQPDKDLRLPDAEGFRKLVSTIRAAGGGLSSGCADLVEFLAYSGLRVNSEAAQLTWADIDMDAGQMVVRGPAKIRTKNYETRVVPIIPELRAVLLRLGSGGRPQNSRPLRVKTCHKALAVACAKTGLARLTHHDLRHLFATRCLASGVDVPTVAAWLGHKDGGALLLKVYSHVLQSHSLEMAKRVRVSAVIGQIPSPTNGEVKQPDADNQPNKVEELSHTAGK